MLSHQSPIQILNLPTRAVRKEVASALVLHRVAMDWSKPTQAVPLYGNLAVSLLPPPPEQQEMTATNRALPHQAKLFMIIVIPGQVILHLLQTVNGVTFRHQQLAL